MSPTEGTPIDDDPRLAFIYTEALRGLLQQQAAIESLHARAGTLIFAASFASSLLGSRALVAGVPAWNWIAIGLLFAIGALSVVMLWPYYNLTFRFDAADLLERYIDAPKPSSMSEIHRSLALQIRADWGAKRSHRSSHPRGVSARPHPAVAHDPGLVRVYCHLHSRVKSAGVGEPELQNFVAPLHVPQAELGLGFGPGRLLGVAVVVEAG